MNDWRANLVQDFFLQINCDLCALLESNLSYENHQLQTYQILTNDVHMLILCLSYSITSVVHRSMPIPGKATGSINTLSTPLLM